MGLFIPRVTQTFALCVRPGTVTGFLLQQTQHLLWQLVGLGDHGGTSLLQNLRTTQAGGFLGKVGIGNATTGSRQVFVLDIDVLD